MNKFPKISIITACYNAEKTIEQTIQSVINQTYDNIEYIIIDGNSTDRTKEIVEKYREKVDVIISEPDRGVYDAFNKGVTLATGDYINFMNADDYFSTDLIVEEITKHLFKYPNTVLLHGNVKAIDSNTGHWHYRGQKLILNDFKKGLMCPHQSVFAHKKLFKEFGGFDLTYKILADVDFTIKCFKNYEDVIIYLPIEVAHFRLGGLSNVLLHEKNMHYENTIIHYNHFGSVPNYTKIIMDNYETYRINQTYKLWLESFLIGREDVSNMFRKKNIAIFGTKRNATYLYHYFTRSAVEVVFFLDNEEMMQTQLLHGKPINSLNSIVGNEVDAIIISVERHEAAQSIKQQLKKQFKNIKVYTWHELIELKEV